jgi:hypothetical protein
MQQMHWRRIRRARVLQTRQITKHPDKRNTHNSATMSSANMEVRVVDVTHSGRTRSFAIYTGIPVSLAASSSLLPAATRFSRLRRPLKQDRA